HPYPKHTSLVVVKDPGLLLKSDEELSAQGAEGPQAVLYDSTRIHVAMSRDVFRHINWLLGAALAQARPGLKVAGVTNRLRCIRSRALL
ncbi:unnamed protein product, partial [Closterium sp. Naga37s-1]